MHRSKRIGVALSGGGYRAAGYHLGTLAKLDELGIINKIDVLSTISGGSIIGAAYCLNSKSFKEFEQGIIKSLTTDSVIGFVLRSSRFLCVFSVCLLSILATITLLFTKYAPLSLVLIVVLVFIFVRFQFRIFPISRIIENAYNKFFFNGATLSSLCEKPEIAIGATNLQTCRHFTFSKRKMEDSSYAYEPEPIFFDGTEFPVAKAVMASSSVPFAFTPISIEKKFFKNPDLYKNIDPKLVDGGVYDNQGIHKITQANSSYSCDIIIVSDAGNKLPFRKMYNNTFTLLLRTVETFMTRIKNFQMMQNLYRNNQNGREIAYQSLGWDLTSCIPGFYDGLKTGLIARQVIEGHKLMQEWIENPSKYEKEIVSQLERNTNASEIYKNDIAIERLNKIRAIATNLTPLKPDLLSDMMTHAGNLTELQIRLYCPSLFTEKVNHD